MRSTRDWFLLCACLALASLAFSGCTKSSQGGSAGSGGAGGAGSAAVGGSGGVATITLPKGQEILFVGGFMSEFYGELSVNLENEV
ncbi:MAG: hypothetical protein JRJ24_17055, partial [Deltaproteobacteria bacterium]|nr:hypothetical protein [Deltaproteobacteria bacterium]